MFDVLMKQMAGGGMMQGVQKIAAEFEKMNGQLAAQNTLLQKVIEQNEEILSCLTAKAKAEAA